MKKISRISMKKQGAILNNDEMAKIMGKEKYRCCCGMGEDITCFDVYAANDKDAVYYLPDLCENGYSGVGGCFLSN